MTRDTVPLGGKPAENPPNTPKKCDIRILPAASKSSVLLRNLPSPCAAIDSFNHGGGVSINTAPIAPIGTRFQPRAEIWCEKINLFLKLFYLIQIIVSISAIGTNKR
ncbi:MAG: hypothetical protein LBH01_01080 [Verrucomicrobiales bacterium]|nr:hypothetical protein [Verrucomicrobiales bacterium]